MVGQGVLRLLPVLGLAPAPTRRRSRRFRGRRSSSRPVSVSGGVSVRGAIRPRRGRSSEDHRERKLLREAGPRPFAVAGPDVEAGHEPDEFRDPKLDATGKLVFPDSGSVRDPPVRRLPQSSSTLGARTAWIRIPTRSGSCHLASAGYPAIANRSPMRATGKREPGRHRRPAETEHHL